MALTRKSLDDFILPFSSRGNVDKKEALENLDLILLCIDEIANGYMLFI